ncbi:TetR/AcrR family transcriptional regulator [Mycolicibacterium sediminis]|uniref:TetR family transcriptional regulator n=1 Tax=Mycolicibacterium sediminis TaxID=1286180 RepID=A0A7I7QK18_9MYCO|nr:TetR/AcrR family transcriptional regulator [Mycolicibacterium sediminis]BBY26440.1 TetR family transcriptional regulator [Mycolicibacterium sediminis]
MTESATSVRSQASRRANSRSLILDAAVELLVERGYRNTTTVAIQERANVSRGRLLHHFPSRDALLVAAAQHLADERIADMERWFERADDLHPAAAERVTHAVDLLWRTFRQPYFWAAMDLWSAARTDADLREQLAASERRLGRAIVHVVATMFGPVHSSHPGFDDLRELLFSSMRGVALTYSIVDREPDSDPHLPMWRSVACRMLDVTTNGQG